MVWKGDCTWPWDQPPAWVSAPPPSPHGHCVRFTCSPGGRWSLWCILASVMDIPSSWDHSHPPTPGGVCAATLTLPFPHQHRHYHLQPTTAPFRGEIGVWRDHPPPPPLPYALLCFCLIAGGEPTLAVGTSVLGRLEPSERCTACGVGCRCCLILHKWVHREVIMNTSYFRISNKNACAVYMYSVSGASLTVRFNKGCKPSSLHTLSYSYH
jgi:hypothetical protein